MLTAGESEKVKILQSYFNTMLFRDLMEHFHIKSPVEVVRYFLKRVMENPAKYYMADIGLRNAVLLQQSADSGKALENIAFRMLENSLGEEDALFYFLETCECDFVVQRSGVVTDLVQVCWALDEDNRERELGGLLEASKYTGCDNCRIITVEDTGTEEYEGRRIAVESICNMIQGRQQGTSEDYQLLNVSDE